MGISWLAEELSASQEKLLRRETEECHDSAVAVGCLSVYKPGVSGTRFQHVTMNTIVPFTDQLHQMQVKETALWKQPVSIHCADSRSQKTKNTFLDLSFSPRL